MKRLFLILILLISSIAIAQNNGNPSKKRAGVSFPNAQRVTTADTIPVLFGDNKVLNKYILRSDLLSGLGGGSSDNLGNHTATQNLNLNGFNIESQSNLSIRRGGSSFGISLNDGTNTGGADVYYDNITFDNGSGSYVFKQANLGLFIEQNEGNYAILTTNQLPSTFTANRIFRFPNAAGIFALEADASGFDGNLTTADNTLQEIAQKVDDLSLSSNASDVSVDNSTLDIAPSANNQNDVNVAFDNQIYDNEQAIAALQANGGGSGGGSQEYNPITAIADGNPEFVIDVNASIVTNDTYSAGQEITWEILDGNTGHGTSYAQEVVFESNFLRVKYPEVKKIIEFDVAPDDSYAGRAYFFGSRSGYNNATVRAFRDVPSGCMLYGNGTTWVPFGDACSNVYKLYSLQNGLTKLDLPNNVKEYDPQAVQITSAGRNNYRIERQFNEGPQGPAKVGFWLVDRTTNARITTPPTVLDNVYISNFGKIQKSLSLRYWTNDDDSTGNKFFEYSNSFAILVKGKVELYLKVWIVSDTSLRAKWQPVDNAVSYRVSRGTDADFANASVVYTGTNLQYLDSGLTQDTNYYYFLETSTDGTNYTYLTKFWTKTRLTAHQN